MCVLNGCNSTNNLELLPNNLYNTREGVIYLIEEAKTRKWDFYEIADIFEKNFGLPVEHANALSSAFKTRDIAVITYKVASLLETPERLISCNDYRALSRWLIIDKLGGIQRSFVRTIMKYVPTQELAHLESWAKLKKDDQELIDFFVYAKVMRKVEALRRADLPNDLQKAFNYFQKAFEQFCKDNNPVQVFEAVKYLRDYAVAPKQIDLLALSERIDNLTCVWGKIRDMAKLDCSMFKAMRLSAYYHRCYEKVAAGLALEGPHS